MLVWGHLTTHLTAGVRRSIADRDWLTVFQLPTYAPDLNPAEMGLSQCEPCRDAAA
ncbi:transposase [Streptomyces incanus]